MDAINDWLQRHELAIDLAVIFIVVVSGYIIAAAMFTAAWTLRGTHDQTAVGRALKRQKVSLGVAFLANAVYWSVVLYAYYTGYIPSVAGKTLLRLIFAGGMLFGAVFASLFVRALRREIGRERYGVAPLAHDGLPDL